MSERVIVTVGANGEITVEADGIVGNGCDALTAAFENGLGTMTGNRKKPEYNRRAVQPNNAQAGAGQ